MTDERTLAEQANAAAIKSVRDEKPASFTVGAYVKSNGQVGGGLTVDRTWKNGWGATAYARAWWNDTAVLPNAPKITGEAGFDVVKRFGEQ